MVTLFVGSSLCSYCSGLFQGSPWLPIPPISRSPLANKKQASPVRDGTVGLGKQMRLRPFLDGLVTVVDGAVDD